MCNINMRYIGARDNVHTNEAAAPSRQRPSADQPTPPRRPNDRRSTLGANARRARERTGVDTNPLPRPSITPSSIIHHPPSAPASRRTNRRRDPDRETHLLGNDGGLGVIAMPLDGRAGLDVVNSLGGTDRLVVGSGLGPPSLVDEIGGLIHARSFAASGVTRKGNSSTPKSDPTHDGVHLLQI